MIIFGDRNSGFHPLVNIFRCSMPSFPTVIHLLFQILIPGASLRELLEATHFAVWVDLSETFPIFMFDYLKFFPIVHTALRRFHHLSQNLEDGLNAAASSECTYSTNISRVLWDLRLKEDDIDHLCMDFFRACSASLFATLFFRSCLLSLWFFPVPTASSHLINASLK